MSSPLTVGDVMTDGLTVAPQDQVSVAASLMAEHDRGAVVVTDGDRVGGHLQPSATCCGWPRPAPLPPPSTWLRG